MTLKTTTFNLGYSYAEIIMKAGEIKQLVGRDLEKFSPCNVTSENLDLFDAKINELVAFRTDLELSAKKINTTELKNNISDQLRLALRNLVIYSKSCYQKTNPSIQPYEIDSPLKLSEPNLVFYSEILATLTLKNIADFNDFNLTNNYCNILLTKVVEYKAAYVELCQKNTEREKATILRWEKVAELYEEMMFYCELGKMIWESVSASRFNDYTLYAGVAAKKAKRKKKKAEKEAAKQTETNVEQESENKDNAN